MKLFTGLKKIDIQKEKKIFTPMNIRFYKREYINKDGKSQIYLSVSSAGVRKRIPIDLYIAPENWDATKQNSKGKTEEDDIFNILIGDIKGRISNIQLRYKATNSILTTDMLMDELKSKDSSGHDFLSFVKDYISKCVLTKSSLSKNLSEIKKLEEYQRNIYFKDVTHQFIDKYRHWLHSVKKNAPTTISYSIKTLVKYIRAAQKYGYDIKLDTSMVKKGSTKGNRVNLTEEEVKKLKEYYESSFINEEYKLSLGYFLFSCYTSLRISDIKNLRRSDLMGDTIQYISKKTRKPHTIILNKSAKSVVHSYPDLFVKWKSDQKMNLSLKKIATICGIKKRIHFHVGRHSFATNYLRRGGALADLQIIMDHSDIATTMVYVHMIESESMKTINIYSDGKLLISKEYTFSKLEKTGGITLEFNSK